MPEALTQTETLTLGQLKALLDSYNLPDDTQVLMEVEAPDDGDTMQVQPSRVMAIRGWGEPSRIVFAW